MKKTSILIVFMLIWLGLSGCIYEEIENKTDKFDRDIKLLKYFSHIPLY